MTLLRFLTCGSVDDGKSTLIGRLLYEQKLIFDDQLAALEKDSRKHGTTGADIDFALLVDGLEAEREQGITIDVAYRYFATEKRSFIVADTPGHEQYTRNMATGASNADLAILLVDARKGLLTADAAAFADRLAARHPPRRAGRQQDRPRRFRQKRRSTTSSPTIATSRASSASRRWSRSRCRRASATTFRRRSARTPWYNGPTLLSHLETRRRRRGPRRRAVPVAGAMGQPAGPRLPRLLPAPSPAARISRGDEIVVANSGRVSKVSGSSTSPTARRDRRGRRRGDGDARRRDRRRARRCAVSRRSARPRSPTSSPRI